MQSTLQSLDEADALLPPLLRDVYRRFDDVASFFEYNPHDPASFERRAAWLDRHFGGRREAVATALVEANRGYGADEAAIANAAALSDPETLAVVTGQQAGLLGGPLHTLYKAVTAVRMAADLSRRLGRRVVPIFWMASEDHDYDEVRRAFVLDQAGRVRELSLPPRAGRRASVGELPVPRRVRGLLREVTQALGPRARHPELLDEAVKALELSRDWGEWFARLMAGWLSSQGLVILDPMLRPLRLLLREFYPLALVRREGIHRELAAAAQRLERRGYPVQLAIEPDHCNLFFYADGERVALHWQDAQLVGRGGQIRLSVGEGATLMREEPWRFSPNVALRPMVQEILLPVLAYVAGPAETAYLAQLRDVYPLFGLQMPVIAPRLSLTLVAPEVGERLRAHRVGAGAFFAGDPGLPLRQELARLDKVGIDARMEELAGRIRQAYAEAREALEPVSPHLDQISRRNEEQVLAQIRYLHRKAHQHHRRAQREVVRDFTYMRNALRPHDSLQERVFSVLPAMVEFGPRLIRWLLRAAADEPHRLAVIDDPTRAGAGINPG